MLPTQPINCGKRWWTPPDFHYTMQSRFAWPTPPPLEGAATAATAGVGAGAGAGVGAAASHLGAAEGAAAAANFASHAAGGVPPRGPWGGHYHHYYQGGPFGRGYGRGWGRRPVLKRVFWFGLGAWIGVSWYKRHQEKKAEFNRQLADPNSPLREVIRDLNRPYPAPSYPNPAGMATPVDHTPYPVQPSASAAQPAPMNTPAPPIPTSTDNYNDRRWGWPEHSERKWGWRHHRHQERAQQARQEAETAAAAAQEESRRTSTATPIQEAVERLWEEKKRDAAQAQETANDRAKEYAREKLDKLSAALETLRESLKQDQAAKVAKEDKKLV
ncbi:hypothetical protein I317_07601 [Kwoniella heveanensis CBS 569]|nr:hypothetical protein I317_07601 [Kwoniella heveanensis CBS 569]